MSDSTQELRSVVVITGYDGEGAIVVRESVEYDIFYGDVGHVIDDNSRIRVLGIRTITGEIYNSTGELQSSFVNFYTGTGEFANGRSIHADGTLLEL